MKTIFCVTTRLTLPLHSEDKPVVSLRLSQIQHQRYGAVVPVCLPDHACLYLRCMCMVNSEDRA